MRIRIAQKRDLPSLVDIYNQAVKQRKIAATELATPASRLPWFESHDPYQHPILVAEKVNHILGYLYISPYRPGRAALRQTAEISYFVDQTHHRQGVATALLGEAEDKCKVLGIRNLFAILLRTNQESIAFLDKHGFEMWAQLPRVAEFEGVEVDQVYYGKRIIEKL